MTKYERLGLVPTFSDRSLMSYFYYMSYKMLMVVLKLHIFADVIAWKMQNTLWKTKKCPVENYGQELAKNCLKTEMHRLVAMHLRIG